MKPILLAALGALSAPALATDWPRIFDFNGNPGYEGPAAIAVDGDGNVLIAGNALGSNGDQDMVALKYDPAGNVLWSASWDGGNSGHDVASGIKLDAEGNAYVVGKTMWYATNTSQMVTLKISSAGRTKWVQTEAGGLDFANPALQVDNDGDIVVMSETKNDENLPVTRLAKYSKLGVRKWSKIESTYSTPSGMVVDAGGNIYVSSSTRYGTENGNALTVRKWSPKGEERWRTQWRPEGARTTNGEAIDIDPDGNLVVAGYCAYPQKSADLGLVKVSATGKILWSAQSNTPALSELLWSLKTDHSGNVVIFGIHTVAGKLYPNWMTTQKWSADGALLWTRRYGSVGDQYTFNRPTALLIDQNDNVIVHGYCRDTPTTIKYSSTGETVWTRRIESVEGTDSFGEALALDETNGYVYLSGELRDGDPMNATYHFQTTRYRN